MSGRSRTAAAIIAAGLVMGGLADALFRNARPGANVLIWTVALVAALWFSARKCRAAVAPVAWWIAAAAVLAASGVAWRDSPVLKLLDILCALQLLGLACWRARDGALAPGGFFDGAFDTLMTGFNTAFGAFLLLGDLKESRTADATRRAIPVIRGLLIATPLLLVFGALLGSADAVFAHLLTRLFSWDLESAAIHMAILLPSAWMVGGWVRCALLREPTPRPEALQSGRALVGAPEILIALGALDLLFLSFVVVQFRYFFGGDALVQATAHLTYADYAHQGFFELVAAIALALPLLLAADHVLATDQPRQRATFRMLAYGLVALLAIVMVSAADRMRLYEQAYGLTQLRFYAAALLAWLATLFVILAGTVLRGHRRTFAAGALAAAFVTLFTLHVINPDAMIVRANMRRLSVRHRFDAAYNAQLSADAAPALRAALASLNPKDRAEVAQGLNETWACAVHQDVRGASLATLAARDPANRSKEPKVVRSDRRPDQVIRPR